MKIIHTKGPVKAEELKVFLEEKISVLFKKQRQADIDFVFTQTGNGIQITQPDMYEDFLFKIEVVNDTELHITKSEHYTDDVNVLTLEDIMNNLFMEYPGRDNIDSIEEQS
jgi:methionine synthase II (cobalamin-independent)